MVQIYSYRTVMTFEIFKIYKYLLTSAPINLTLSVESNESIALDQFFASYRFIWTGRDGNINNVFKNRNLPRISFCGNHFLMMRFSGLFSKLSSSHFHNTTWLSFLNTLRIASLLSTGNSELRTFEPKFIYTAPYFALSKTFWRSWIKDGI